MSLALFHVVILTAAIKCQSQEITRVVYISRHGVRTPYPPPTVGTTTDWSPFTDLTPPGAAAWNMSQTAFDAQHLTPHGTELIKIFGRYFQNKWSQEPLRRSCDDITVMADNSARDIQTARAWLEGYGCSAEKVYTAYDDADIEPVLSDAAGTCDDPALPTEEEVPGFFGGDVDAMTASLTSGIQGIQDLLPGMDPLLCEQVNNESPGDVNRTACTLFDLKYHYTGTEYYEAMFYSPLQYSQFFAEAFMLQYTSGLEEVAWGQLGDDVPKELSSLYGQHVALMTLVANRWTSLTYGSQLLGYIVAALAQSAGLGLDLDGLGPVKPSDSILLLFAHDTNQAYLREMLELTWFIEGWPMDSLATGGVLSFELVQDENRQFVMVKYTTATPQQQHDATPLDSGTPPSEAYLIIPECGTHQCPFDEFQRIALSRLSMSCVSEPLRTTLEGLQQQGASAKNSWGVRTVYKSPNPRSMALLFFAGVVVAMMSLRIGAVFKRSCARGWQRNRERAATASMYVRYHDLPSQMTKHDASVVSTKITLMRLGGSPLQ